MTGLLEAKSITANYGAVCALRDVNLVLNKNEIVTLLGANGAGKTTLLKSLMRVIPLKRGDVLFEGKSLLGTKTDQIVKSGMALVPEGRGILGTMSVLENLELGAYHRKDWEEDLEKIFLLFPVLKARVNQYAGTLSGGEQQMLAIGRALLSQPKVLLLDEPSLGLAPKIIQRIFELIEEIRQSGVSILLVEQNANMALKVADRVYCLEVGELTLSGQSKSDVNLEELRKSYLGG